MFARVSFDQMCLQSVEYRIDSSLNSVSPISIAIGCLEISYSSNNECFAVKELQYEVEIYKKKRLGRRSISFVHVDNRSNVRVKIEKSCSMASIVERYLIMLIVPLFAGKHLIDATECASSASLECSQQKSIVVARPTTVIAQQRNKNFIHWHQDHKFLILFNTPKIIDDEAETQESHVQTRVDQKTEVDDVPTCHLMLTNDKFPQWTDACNPRSAFLGGTVIHVDTSRELTHPVWAVEKAHRDQGLFLASVAAHRNQTQIVKANRTKRSIITNGRQFLSIGQLINIDGRGSFSSKQYKSWITKKTSFYMSKKYSKLDHNMYRSSGSKTIQHDQNQKISLDRITNAYNLQEAEKLAKKTAESLVANDVKVSWHLAETLATLRRLKGLANRVHILTKKEQDLAAPDQERQKFRWFLPEFNHSQSPSGGLYDGRIKILLINMTHYLEFFSVAFEQMTCEHDYTQTSEDIYRELYSMELRLLCQSENFIKMLENFSINREKLRLMVNSRQNNRGGGGIIEMLADQEELIKYFRQNDIDYVISYKRFMRFTGGDIESPLVLKVTKDYHLAEDNHITIPKHVWREVMPIDQRRLASKLERVQRDRFIISNFLALMNSYESLLLSNSD